MTGGHRYKGKVSSHSGGGSKKRSSSQSRGSRTSMGSPTSAGDRGYGQLVQSMSNNMMALHRQTQAQSIADINTTQMASAQALQNLQGFQNFAAEKGYGQTVDNIKGGLGAQQDQIATNLRTQKQAAADYGTGYGNLLAGMRGTTEARYDRLQPQAELSALEGQLRTQAEAERGYGRISDLALQREQLGRQDIAQTEQSRMEAVNVYRDALSQFKQDRGATLNAALEKRLEGAEEFGKAEEENIANALLEHNAGVMIAGAASGFSTSMNAKMQEGLMKSLGSSADVGWKKEQLKQAAMNDWTTQTIDTADKVLAGKKSVSDILDKVLSDADTARRDLGKATTATLAQAAIGFNEAVLAATKTSSQQVVDFVKDKILKVNEAERDIDGKQIAAFQLLGNLDMKLVETASKAQLDALSQSVNEIGKAIDTKTKQDIEAIKSHYTNYVNLLKELTSLRTAARIAGTSGVMNAYGEKFKGLSDIYGAMRERQRAVMGAAKG